MAEEKKKIPASLVKELRDRTGAGFMDAKKALIEAGGDLDKAAEILRKMGVIKAEKKLSREAKEGKVKVLLSPDRRRAAIVELNCETDFVARTDEFTKLLEEITKAVLEGNFSSVEEFLKAQGPDGDTWENYIKSHIAKIGENIKLRRFEVLEASEGAWFDYYIHAGDMLGVVVEAKGPQNEKAAEAVHNIALQIAAMDPIAVRREDIPEEVLQKEREIYREQALKSGKPEHIVDRIVEGKMKVFYEERVLLEQIYVKDQEITVGEYLKRVSEELGEPLEIVRFVRYKVGEG